MSSLPASPASSDLVSVIVPAYNHQAFVAEAIESVLAQQVEFELIVIDDGSTDRTPEIVDQYRADPRVQVIHQRNAGSHAAINRGLSLARGRYVAILNSDDRFAPNRLATLVALARSRHPLPTFAVTGVRLIDGLGQVVEDVAHPWLVMYRQILEVWGREQDPLQTLLWGNFAVSTSNLFADRVLIDTLGPMRPRRYVLDWEYALRALARCPEAFVFRPDLPLLDYRMHGNNTILRGAVRNHLEAAHLLRSAIAAAWGPKLARPLRRIALLERFLRREEWLHRIHENKVLAASLNDVKQERDAAHAALAQGLENIETLKDQLRAAWTDVAASNERERLLDERLHARDAELQVTRSARDALLARTAHAEAEIRAMRASVSWRITSPLRRLMTYSRNRPALRRALLAARRVAAAAYRTVRGGAVAAPAGQGAGAHALAGPGDPAVPGTPLSPRCTADYAVWLAAEARALEALKAQAPRLVAALPQRPRFSIVVPVFDTDPAMLAAMLDSVSAQWYPDWELCVCDDASTRADTRALIDRRVQEEADAAQRESRARRFRFVRRERNGHIVTASNEALGLAQGDWVVLLDHDDLLAPHALLRLAQTIAEQPDAQLIYTDEDKLDEQGLRCLPFFKPDWSPALLVTQNYIGHLVCVRRALVRAVGGFRDETEGSQDYDLLLRIAQHLGNPPAGGRLDGRAAILHLPEVLYHWRMHAGSTSSSSGAKPYAHEAGRLALERALDTRYGDAFDWVEDGRFLFTYAPRFRRPDGLKVSLIVPTRDRIDLLDACVRSLRDTRAGADWELLILDNGSVEPASHDWFARIQQEDPRVRVLPASMAFNWSRLNNLGARSATGQVLLFLNNDTEVITEDWLGRMAEWALLPDVGTVGAQLLYGDGTIQHAGVAVGMGGWADHPFKAMAPEHFPSPTVSSQLTRNVLASTGACVAISRATFDALGGFDEEFEICGSDVEIALRAHRRGLQNVYLADVQLRHHESKTRSPHVPQNDFVQSQIHYAPYREQGDPFWNPNLSRDSTTPMASDRHVSALADRALAGGLLGAHAAITSHGPSGEAATADRPEAPGGAASSAARRASADAMASVERGSPGASVMRGDPATAADALASGGAALAGSSLPAAPAVPAGVAIDVPEVQPIVGRASPATGPRLNLLLPSLQPQHLFGGIATALQFFLELARDDGRLRIVLTDQADPPDPATLPESLRGWTVVDASDNGAAATEGRTIVAFGARADATLAVGAGDRFMATGWWTAYCAQRLLEWQARQYGADRHPLLYFVQDFEPGFYPWSTRYMLALSTYTWDGPLLPVFNTGLLRAYFERQDLHFERAWSFEPQLTPALARVWSQAEGGFDKRRRLIVYGRPGTPRNAFELVCQGLRHWCAHDHSSRSWDLHSLGEPHAPVPMPGDNRLVSLGKLSLDAYAAALSESAIGVSLMLSPHPSYPPLEMAQFGVRVVTNGFANKDLGAAAPGIVSLRAPTPEAIGEALAQLAEPWRNRRQVHVERPAQSLFSPAGAAWPFIDELRAGLGLR